MINKLENNSQRTCPENLHSTALRPIPNRFHVPITPLLTSSGGFSHPHPPGLLVKELKLIRTDTALPSQPKGQEHSYSINESINQLKNKYDHQEINYLEN
eukprot:TRINITY_DN3353_c0_g2_i2.p1 TRINITY_DN3353_c0_g2~~TRINITY_DN3353_c0_g2_i2.p1  ORF type:complete len:100 (+),score=3.01 TRINITY_DN3353_c0_g2_i2:154-453(+)